MLVIRKEQTLVFSQYMLNQFQKKMQLHLIKRYPEQTKQMTENQLKKLIVDGIEIAEGYKITDENDVKRFLEYLVVYGRNFGTSSETKWAYQFLINNVLNGTKKMNAIDDYDLFVITLGKSDE